MKGFFAFAISLIILLFPFGCENTKEKELPFDLYSEEELLTMFETDRADFQQVAQILLDTPEFWEKGKRQEGDLHPWVSDKTIGLFAEEDQAVLENFIQQTRPYSISLNYRKTVSIVYINADQTDGYTFMYFPAETEAAQYDLESWIKTTENRYEIFRELGENWFFYGSLLPLEQRSNGSMSGIR